MHTRNNHTYTLDIDKLIPSDYNPRTITKKNYEKLKKSIQTYGMLSPIIVNNNRARKKYIVGGHQRYRVAKELGYKTVNCKYIYATPEEEKKLNLSLNKVTGDWDKDILANQFEIEQLLDIGFTKFELGIIDFSEPSSKAFTTKLSYDSYEKTIEVIERIKALNDYNDAEAFMHMIQYFWKGTSVRANNNKHLYKNE